MEVPLVSPAERQQLVSVWSDTETPVPEACLHELIAAQAARTPEAVAVVFEGSELSYSELDRESDQLAAWLSRNGVAAESLVGIALEPGPQLVVALLAYRLVLGRGLAEPAAGRF